ncbi:MAG: BrnA antitoxin family protein [Deltaproteobacteria bacterium]|nr:BrnA antitoxin family protein [Deltaproteobacteria bacterium]
MSKIPDPNRMKRIKGPHLTKQELNSAKVRITTYLDQNIMSALKEMADQSGSKYQTILNQILRDYIYGQKQGLIARIDRLEKIVFKKKQIA